MAALKDCLKKARSTPLPELIATLKRKLRGYWNYYGVRGNSMRLGKYQYEVHRLPYKWLNRRSQRRSMKWRTYCDRWKTWDMPTARVVEIWPNPLLHQPSKPA
ncbi:MAG: maturase [Verrucomicrobia bacterium]|nr:maturase [Verrucomicrobiota bacterium]